MTQIRPPKKDPPTSNQVLSVIQPAKQTFADIHGSDDRDYFTEAKLAEMLECSVASVEAVRTLAKITADAHTTVGGRFVILYRADGIARKLELVVDALTALKMPQSRTRQAALKILAPRAYAKLQLRS